MAAEYIAIVKRDYVPLVGNDEEVIPGNLGALKFGLQALLKEDASDYERAAQLWALAEAELAKDREDDQGAGAAGKMQVEDHLEMASVGEGL